MRRWIAVIALVAFLPVAGAGCFGRFQLTRKLYGFNRTVSSDKWIRWLVFLGLAIFPVYFWAMLIDAFFGNSIEFWGGNNPFSEAAPRTRVAHGPDGEVLRVTRSAPGAIALELTDRYGVVHRGTVVRVGDGLMAFDGEGRLVARVPHVGGEPSLAAVAR